jgi:hypothetical protein
VRYPITDSHAIYLIALWPIAFVVIWGIWNMVRDSLDGKRVLRAKDWPEAQGVVASSRVVWAHVEVIYEYWIASGSYKGRYKLSLQPVVPDHYARGAARTNAEAGEDLAEYPPGTKVIVRYNPQRPQESVLYCKGSLAAGPSDGASGIAPEFIVLN